MSRIVRLILDGTVVRARLDRKATAISLLVVIGVRANGQKVLLAVRSMGQRERGGLARVFDDLIKRGLRRPEFLIVDGAADPDKAIAAVWDAVPVFSNHFRDGTHALLLAGYRVNRLRSPAEIKPE
jgi:putative transposase